MDPNGHEKARHGGRASRRLRIVPLLRLDVGLLVARDWATDLTDLETRLSGAVARTIKRWQQSGKRLPLHWNHETGAESIIGAVDAASLREGEEGLYVKGQLDLEESEVARSAWRSMKNNAVSLSFGFMAVKSRERGDGVPELLELDLFEVSVVPHPANADTRFLDLKSATGAAETDDDLDSMDLDQLRARSMAAIAGVDLKSHRPIQIATFEA